MSAVIEVDDIYKMYLLGNFGYGTIRHDLQSWIARLKGKDDPNAKVHGPRIGENEEFWALKGVSFSVEEGSKLAIVGKNGSGKSTILKILSRLTTPTSGEIRIRGRIASLLEVGTGFHPELTGRENVYLNGAILGMRRHEIREKIDSIVSFAEVEQFIDTPVKRYSSGMYIRLAFAIAAHLNSDILLLDEVLAVGDAGFQEKCLKKIQEISRSGKTIVFVSHSEVQVQALCDQAILLDHGKMETTGTVKEVFTRYNELLHS